MILKVISHSALCTKIKCLLGKMLKQDDYEMLLRCQSVNSVAQKLKEFEVFSDALLNVDSKRVHRSDLEYFLQSEFILEFKKLYNFSDNITKNFYDAYFSKVELDLLKIIAIDINLGVKNDEEVNEFVQKHTTFDIVEMRNCKTLDELADKLKYYGRNSILYNMLKTHKELTIFDFEMTIDIYSYQRLMEIVKKDLSGDDKVDASHILGYEIDLENLKWIYRSKMNFNMSDEMVYSYIIPNYYKLNAKMIAKMVKAQTKEEFLSVISKTCYSQIFKEDDFEHSMNLFKKRMYKIAISKYPYSFLNILCYLMLRKIESANIVSIIEGIRYKLSPEEIKEFLVI